MIKLGLKLKKGENHIWCQLLLGKYDRNNNNMESVGVKAQDSSLWKYIEKNWPIKNASTIWDISNGFKVNAWNDCWLQLDKLLKDFVQDLQVHHVDRVVDLLKINGDWNINLLEGLLNVDTIAEIRAIHPPRNENGEESCIWKEARDGNMSVSRAYETISKNNSLTDTNGFWKQI